MQIGNLRKKFLILATTVAMTMSVTLAFSTEAHAAVGSTSNEGGAAAATGSKANVVGESVANFISNLTDGSSQETGRRPSNSNFTPNHPSNPSPNQPSNPSGGNVDEESGYNPNGEFFTGVVSGAIKGLTNFWSPDGTHVSSTTSSSIRGFGVTSARSGWLITLVGDAGTPILGSRTVFFGYNGWQPSGSGSLRTYQGVSASGRVTDPIVNSIAFLALDGGYPSGGGTIVAKLRSVVNGVQYAYTVMETYLGVSKQDLMNYLANGNSAYLQCVGIYQGGTSTSLTQIAGPMRYGNCIDMAQGAHHPSRLSNVELKSAPNSAMLEFDVPWGVRGIPIDNPRNSSAGLISSRCLGECCLIINESFQVVHCIENTTTGEWMTDYGSCGKTTKKISKNKNKWLSRWLSKKMEALKSPFL